MFVWIVCRWGVQQYVHWWDRIAARMKGNQCVRVCAIRTIKNHCEHYSEIAYKIHLFQFNHFGRHSKVSLNAPLCPALPGPSAYSLSVSLFANASRWIDRQIGLSQWKTATPPSELYCSNENNWIKFWNNFALSHKTHFNAQSHSWIHSIHKSRAEFSFSFSCKLN